MHKVKLVFLTLMSIAFLTACGTIIQSTTQQVGISSNPSNAKVTINGQSKGTTPMVLDLKRKDTHMVRIELEGYEPYETTLTRKTSGWVWGNIVFGGLIGLVVDASSGGMYKLTPEQIASDLKSKSLSTTSDNDKLVMAIVLKPNPEWEKVGQIKKK